MILNMKIFLDLTTSVRYATIIGKKKDDFIGVKGDKNTSTDKKIWNKLLIISFLCKKCHRLSLQIQLLPSNRLWLCGVQKTRAEKIIRNPP